MRVLDPDSSPKEVGGGGLSLTDMFFVHEAVYQHGIGVTQWMLSWTEGPNQMLMQLSADQKQRYLAPLMRGEETAAYAITEYRGGSDVLGMQTQAKRRGDEWSINGTKAQCGKTLGDVAWKIKHEMALSRSSREKARVVRRFGDELSMELGANLIGFTRDTRADRGRDPPLGSAEPGHRAHCRFEHAGLSAAPSGVGGTDNAGLGVGEQNRCAVGSQDAKGDASAPGDDGVRLRPLFDGPGLLDHGDFGGLDLIDRVQILAAEAEVTHGAIHVLAHSLGIVPGSEATIKRREQAFADAALAGEESVAYSA